MNVGTRLKKSQVFHLISYTNQMGGGRGEGEEIYIFLSFTSMVDNVTCPCIFTTDLYTITIVIQDNGEKGHECF